MRLYDYASYLEKETDPFFIREIMTAFVSYLFLSEYYIIPTNQINSTQLILSIAGSGYFAVIMFYCMIISSINAHLFERGSIQFILTMPVKRLRFFVARIFASTIFTGLAFIIPFILLVLFEQFSIEFSLWLEMLFIIFSSLVFFLSIGHLLSSVFRNGLVTFSTLFVLFIFLSQYAHPELEKQGLFENVVLGVYSLTFSRALNSGLFYGSVIEIALSVPIILLYYLVVTNTNLRSGR